MTIQNKHRGGDTPQRKEELCLFVCVRACVSGILNTSTYLPPPSPRPHALSLLLLLLNSHYKNSMPTPKLKPFLLSSLARMTSGRLKLISKRARGCAYTSPTPAAALGSSSLRLWIVLVRVDCVVELPSVDGAGRASRRPPLMKACSLRGVSLPTRGRGRSRLAPPAA
jgi:hypothetical protein